MAAELLGAQVLSRKLDALARNVRGPILRKAANAAVKPVLDSARSLIPVNKVEELHKTYKGRLVAPGFAKRSIAAKVTLSQDGRAVFARMGVKREAFYAVSFVELGTSKMAAEPWLRPAFEKNQSAVLKRFAEVLKQQIDKVTLGK